MPVSIVYEVQYEVCALLFLLLITARFFSMRRFPNRPNHLFGVILVCAIADILLDILGSYTIMAVASVPPWVNYVINMVYYALQIIFPALLMTYVLYSVEKRYRTVRPLLLLLLPVTAFLGMLLLNPITGGIFYIAPVDGVNCYFRGPFFITLYIGTAFYLAVTIFLLHYYRSMLELKIRRTIFRFILISAVAVVLQFYFPQLLLTGVALSIAILMMFFNIQNPDDMLDLISGVFNYDAMMAFLDAAISRRDQLWFIVVDIGGIRRVNSAYGLSVGNRVFSRVGSFFNDLDEGLWAFRMFGTRFLLATTREVGFSDAVVAVANRFEQSWVVGVNTLDLSATIRYYDAPNLFRSPEEVINLIDTAFADMEACSWGHCMRIGKEMMAFSRRSTQVEDALRDALRTGRGFSLYYQPIYNVNTGQFSSAEALLRLNSPALGPISPAEFIPIAEKSGQIVQIDEFVIRTACDFLSRCAVPELLEINLSAAEFHRNPAARILFLIEESGADPRRICFEVTETAAIGHPDILVDFMSNLICRGFRFALDDFGTGYANITQVTSLPFSIAKMDKILLSDDAKTRVVFDSLSGMFSHIGVATVVEGVETQEQAQRVCTSADFIQGFYYAKPMPEADFIAFLKEKNS